MAQPNPPPPSEVGEDLWLPERLAAVGFLLEGEARIHADYLRLLESLLEVARGNVLKPTQRIIDPFGVFAGLTRFNKMLTDFLNGGIKLVLRRAYERVLHEGYAFTNRPFVAQHLDQVRNHMVRTPDEVFAYVRRDVDEGTNAGESIPQIAERIDSTLLRTGAERWQNRAVVVARTEALSAYNGGTNDAFQVIADETDAEFEKVWLATMDTRTRDTHFVADGQRVPFASPFIVGGFPGMYPGDPTLPASERIQCRCTMLVVEPGENVDMAGRGWKPETVTRAEVAARRARGVVRTGDQ